jgi:cysteine desulfurase
MNWFKQRRIFMDYASATPVLPEVMRTMEKYWSRGFFNSSAIYQEGLLVKGTVERCRSQVARLLGVSASGVVFTSGGTESDNLAILGAFEESKKVFKIPHLIISAIEHPAVMATAEEVARRGGDVSICETDTSGVISPEALKKLVKRNTFLVSVGLANSEIGTIQPIAKIGRLLRKVRKERGSVYPLLHTDASAAPSFLSVNIETLQADMLTLDGSKIYGPKGIGVLAVRGGVKISPIIFGGSQEGGRRAGTPNQALIVGLATALEIAEKDREKESKRLENLRKYFIEQITKGVPKAIINGSPNNHLPNIVSLSIPGILSEFILLKLDREGVMVSVGATCSLDEKVSGSPVIRAIDKPELAESTLRFSFGRFTTENEIKTVAEILPKCL